MKIKLLYLCLAVFSFLHSFSQFDTGKATNVTKVLLLSPGLSGEAKVGKSQTIYGQAAMDFAVYFGYSDALGTKAGINLYPSANIEYRYYYNFQKRMQLDKRTELNSANYFAASVQSTLLKERVSYYPGTSRRRLVNAAGVVWGLQRNYRSRFSLDFNIGPGYAFANEIKDSNGQVIVSKVSTFTVISQLNLGIWLNKRK